MGANKTIQKLVAGLMLLLFAISITPRQVLHDAITGHKHNYAISTDAQSLQGSKNGFQCNWEAKDVISSFIAGPEFQIAHPPAVYSSHFNFYLLGEYFTQPFFSSLRGPPSQV